MKIRTCKICVLPENFPHIEFDKNGVCNICRLYKGHKAKERIKKKYLKKFKKTIKESKGKSDYDVLMCYSGGKDSTYALSILKSKYNLKILAYTFDNGFVPERTYINIKNVTEKFGIDHIFFKPHFDLLKKIFSKSLKTSLYPKKAMERASAVCTSCMGLVKYSAIKTAIEKKIPMISFGWSPGQAPITSAVLEINPSMIKTMEKVLKNPMIKMAGKGIASYFPSEKQYDSLSRSIIFIHPLAVHPYNEKNILKKIKEFGWEKPKESEMNATNCLLNPLADLAHIRRYRFHPYVLEIANFVREGYMTRKEGLKHIPFKKNKKLINKLKKRLGVK